MALDLQAASGMIVRPDIRPKTIELKCGIHTGPVVAGTHIISEKYELSLQLGIFNYVLFTNLILSQVW